MVQVEEKDIEGAVDVGLDLEGRSRIAVKRKAGWIIFISRHML